MRRKYGILLIESEEVIFRIYAAGTNGWMLLRYHNTSLQNKPVSVATLLEIIATFFMSDTAQHIEEWKICSRHLPPQMATELSNALGIHVESISLLREQELLCKGMFSELW